MSIRRQREPWSGELLDQELVSDVGRSAMRRRQPCQYRIGLERSVRYQPSTVVDHFACCDVVLVPRRECGNRNAGIDDKHVTELFQGVEGLTADLLEGFPHEICRERR